MCFLVYFFILFLSASCLNEDYKELRKMLTKKDLQSWLHNATVPQNNNNKYCNLCCIKIGFQTMGKKCGSHTLCKYPVTNIQGNEKVKKL